MTYYESAVYVAKALLKKRDEGDGEYVCQRNLPPIFYKEVMPSLLS